MQVISLLHNCRRAASQTETNSPDLYNLYPYLVPLLYSSLIAFLNCPYVSGDRFKTSLMLYLLILPSKIQSSSQNPSNRPRDTSSNSCSSSYTHIFMEDAIIQPSETLMRHTPCHPFHPQPFITSTNMACSSPQSLSQSSPIPVLF